MRPVDVFIHSSPHSGSTWLGYVLGSSSYSAFVGELFRAWDESARVPCTLCAARGLSACTLLHGIEETDPDGVFSLISRRSGKRMIVDNSKSIDWTRRFIGRPDRDLHIVHVVKDPRSRWASLRRRQPGQALLEETLDNWYTENEAIWEFATQSRLPATVVAYDTIAADQEREVAALFASLGSAFEPAALRYWEIDHHGFAANGASSSLIEHRKFDAPPNHFSTADDAFYKGMFGRTFVDLRWKSELPQAEIEAVMSNRNIASLLKSLGYRLTPAGMEHLEPAHAPWTPPAGRPWTERIRTALGL